ncbi:MAG: hypothetical protein EHM35_07200 [Planctomycetaceae bacterium]|nr:MAG: hypothetical protein EHM35_07200 [Planctomycetaceae bacterium]
MTDQILIEPAQGNAAAFAVWCLSRSANIRTVSAGGFLIPLDWYPDVPSELLEGAHVDGFLYNRPESKPVTTPEPVVTDTTPQTTAASTPTRKRNHRARKASQE